MKTSLKFPAELLSLFSAAGQAAVLEKVSAVHMFESSPQSKCAVAYVLRKADGDSVALVVVYSVSTNHVLRLLRSESEVCQMCTPGDDSLLIVGTVHGSLALYDLREFDAQQRDEDLDYALVLNTY